MKLDRRALLGALGLTAVGAAGVAPAQEQAPAAAPPAVPAQSLEDRITQRASENRHRLSFDGAGFSGEGYDLLVAEGRATHYFCIGEEHGVAENPKLAAQLFGALAPSGYAHVSVEISPPMAAELDRAARGGVDGLRQLFTDPGSQVAFFGMREEAEWLASARAAAHGRQVIRGLDYEVGADRSLIRRLQAKRKPAAAATALAAVEAASNAAWAQYAETRGPQFIFSFSGDPALVRAVRQAWPNADDEAEWMLETLEETLTINQLWVSNQAWASNQRRAEFNRRNLRRYWAADDGAPKIMFKMGAGHMVRGLSHTQVFDVGSAVSEHAEAMGAKSFHMMVLPGAGTQVAQFDPSAWTYRPSDVETYADMGMTPLLAAAYSDAMTLIDLRPIRPLVFGARHKRLDPDLVRAIHGFDALLVMSGSTASANL